MCGFMCIFVYVCVCVCVRAEAAPLCADVNNLTVSFRVTGVSTQLPYTHTQTERETEIERERYKHTSIISTPNPHHRPL